MGNSMNPIDNAIEFRESMCPVMPECCDNDELSSVLDRVLSDFSTLEKQVLNMRFGRGLTTDYTLKRVAEILDICNIRGEHSGEKVRQIEAKALRKLRHPSRAESLRSFLDWI